MKPKDLQSPFTWQERHILIHEQILYVPKNYSQYKQFQFPGWNHKDVFGCDKPVKIEYCSGNGTWIAAKAATEKEFHWVAVEKKFVRVRKIWSKIKNNFLSNLFAVCGEAYISTHHYFPLESVEEIFINFPDPWPKNRHAKFRLIQPQFIKEMWRILKTKGTITIVTDDPAYSLEIIKLMNLSSFTSLYPDPYYSNDLPDYGTSFFEDLWRSQMKGIRYHRFQKQ